MGRTVGRYQERLEFRAVSSGIANLSRIRRSWTAGGIRADRKNQPTMAKLTVVLSEQAPVEIDTQVWPDIASAYSFHSDVRMMEETEASIIVREHADGRRLVYCQLIYKVGTKTEASEFGGFVLNELDQGEDRMAEDTVRAIRRCAGILIKAGERRPGIVVQSGIGSDCIADLPPVAL
jgi:hypothetical protein